MGYKMPTRAQDSNKGTFGKVLNFAGSKNYVGAAYLSTVAVLKSGAGYVALASDKNIIRTVSSILPEAVYLSRFDGLRSIEKFNIIMLGCGLGKSFFSRILFKKIIKKLQQSAKPLLIDADGLNILAEIDIKLPQTTVITPHPLEASRLLACSVDEVLADLEGTAKRLTQKYNCVTVLKCHNSVICNKNLEIYINKSGNSALAKAGSGDVLAGIISGLLAQKMEIFEAVKLGVYLHGRCGELASEELTEYSVLASDITKYLPLAIKEINQQL